MVGYYPIRGQQEASRFPFDADFFKRKFPRFLRESCDVGEETQVLEILLTSGRTVDVSHIEEVDDDYLLLAAFLDDRDCSNLFRTYVRYDSIYQVNIVSLSTKTRPVGFNVAYKTRVTAGEKARKTPGPTRKKDKGKGKRKAKTAALKK